ncbi:MAG TPA: hypothetical protein VFM77_13180 [Terriglobales bacterium]|nr:hypothetical protein [Terriglobales bacterium]
MKHFAGIVSLLLFVCSIAAAQTVPRQLLSTPTRLELDRPSLQAQSGTTVNYTVTLKNAANQPVTASNDLALQVETPSGTKSITILKGQSSATFTWQANAAGIGRMQVRSGKLHPASGLVLVAPNPASQIHAPVAIMEHAPAHASPPPPPPPTHHLPIGAVATASPTLGALGQPAGASVASPAAPQATKLALFVTPTSVLGNALDHTWTATVDIAAQGNNGEILPVASAVQIHLTSNLGQFTPADLILQPGEFSNFGNAVTLKATRAGKDSVQAVSSLGNAGPVEVDYMQPAPAKLQILLGTPQLQGSGSSSVSVQVCLADEAGAPTVSGDDLQVTLDAAGQFSKSPLSIPHDLTCSEQVTWTAQKSGVASITARAEGGIQGENTVTFPSFPWYLVWLAALGGILGAVILHTDGLFSEQWWAHTWRSLVVGGVLGAIIYLLARYGAVIVPSSIPITLQNIPAVSGTGSFVLGFVGGIFGRKILKIDDNEAGSPPQAQGAAGGH